MSTRERGPEAPPTDRTDAIAQRFRVWTVAVVAVAVLVPTAIVVGRIWATPVVRVAAVATVSAVCASLLLLIVTTPPDAVRLPMRTSVRLIAGLTLWTWAVQWACAGHDCVDLFLVLIATTSARLLATGLASLGRTPWWAGVLLWSPIALGPYALPQVAVALLALVTAIAVGLLARPHRLAAF